MDRTECDVVEYPPVSDRIAGPRPRQALPVHSNPVAGEAQGPCPENAGGFDQAGLFTGLEDMGCGFDPFFPVPMRIPRASVPGGDEPV